MPSAVWKWDYLIAKLSHITVLRNWYVLQLTWVWNLLFTFSVQGIVKWFVFIVFTSEKSLTSESLQFQIIWRAYVTMLSVNASVYRTSWTKRILVSTVVYSIISEHLLSQILMCLHTRYRYGAWVTVVTRRLGVLFTQSARCRRLRKNQWSWL